MGHQLVDLKKISPPVSPAMLFSSDHGFTNTLKKKGVDPVSNREIYCLLDGRMREFLQGGFSARIVKNIGITLIMNDLSDGKTCSEPDVY